MNPPPNDAPDETSSAPARRFLFFAGPRSPQQLAGGPHGGERILTLFDRLAHGYGFNEGSGAFDSGGGTRTYLKDGFTLEMTARGEPGRPGRQFVYEGRLTRHLDHAPPLAHALPVLEYNPHSRRYENRTYRESAERFARDLAEAAVYLSAPDEYGWASARVAELHAGRSTGFLRRHGAERIYFNRHQLTPRSWLPVVDHPVRYRCDNVVQGQWTRVTAYRALEVCPVEESPDSDDGG